MKVRYTTRVCSILLVVSLGFAGSVPAGAQEKDHAVSQGQLRQDVQKAAETRRANEAAVREMFASEKGREALKSAGIDYQKIDQAIGQVNDEDLARMADRSREVQKDFAAGRFSDRDLIILLLVVVGLILVIVAVR
jgi:pyruvate/2-oxoglutarate dehydrogenase complex dihydrolipoamide acyltransferase (E2) component